MIFRETDIEGAWIIELEKRTDERGYFARVWCEKELSDRRLNSTIAQINTGVSPHAGTLRGLHYQAAPHAEVKVARCLRGAAFDVAIDLRPQSTTFCRWTGVTLRPAEGRSLYVPEGCAHGYLTLEDDTELMYLTSYPYAAVSARGVRYDDPAFKIPWPHAIKLVSEADRSWPDFQRTSR